MTAVPTSFVLTVSSLYEDIGYATVQIRADDLLVCAVLNQDHLINARPSIAKQFRKKAAAIENSIGGFSPSRGSGGRFDSCTDAATTSATFF